jgi:hypothetical protein
VCLGQTGCNTGRSHQVKLKPTHIWIGSSGIAAVPQNHCIHRKSAYKSDKGDEGAEKDKLFAGKELYI